MGANQRVLLGAERFEFSQLLGEGEALPPHTPNLSEIKVTFIGAGRVVHAIVSGLVTAGLSGSQIHVTNRGSSQRMAGLAQRWSVHTHTDKAAAVAGADVLFLAVKPIDMATAVAEVMPHITGAPLIISVAAGVPLETIAQWTDDKYALVRAMPNSSSRVLASSTALAFGDKCTDGQCWLAEALFSAIGTVITVPEGQMDAVTGLSGSGPAYVYRLMEGLIEAGRMAGLPAELSRQLSIETLYGAARMLAETGDEPVDLRQEVTSPGGTTAAGLAVLEQHGFTEALHQAVIAATRRSGELSTAYTEATELAGL